MTNYTDDTVRLKYTSRRNLRLLHEIIGDINAVITKVHKLRVDFAKGSVNDRLVQDLDGARITARAILKQQEKPDVNLPTQVHPPEHPD